MEVESSDSLNKQRMATFSLDDFNLLSVSKSKSPVHIRSSVSSESAWHDNSYDISESLPPITSKECIDRALVTPVFFVPENVNLKVSENPVVTAPTIIDPKI